VAIGFALTGCSAANSVGSGTLPSQSPSEHLTRTSAKQQSFEQNRTSQACAAGGGSWSIPALSGNVVSGTIAYGGNDCGRSTKIAVDSVSFGTAPCYGLSGYSSIGLNIEFAAAHPWKFSGTGSTVTVSSGLFSAATSYTALLVEQLGKGKAKVLFQEPAGTPQNGTLTFASPFQKGFVFPTKSYAALEFCYNT
jgi:hypothetical protein